jgi:hypothetical protein
VRTNFKFTGEPANQYLAILARVARYWFAVRGGKIGQILVPVKLVHQFVDYQEIDRNRVPTGSNPRVGN